MKFDYCGKNFLEREQETFRYKLMYGFLKNFSNCLSESIISPLTKILVEFFPSIMIEVIFSQCKVRKFYKKKMTFREEEDFLCSTYFLNKLINYIICYQKDAPLKFCQIISRACLN